MCPPGAPGNPLQCLAGIRSRGFDPVLFAAAARKSHDRIEPPEDHRQRNGLALRRRVEARVEDVSGWPARILLLAALFSWPAHAHGAPLDKRLPTIGPAPDFTLTSQDGARVSLQDFRGKVVAVAFIFASCTDVCPMLTDNMARVQDKLGTAFGPQIAFVSITVDPERDTPEVLKQYAENFGADLKGWSFLTGDPAIIREIGRKYGLFARKVAEGDVDHTSLTSLIDPDGILRVQYLGVRFNLEEFRGDLLSLLEESK
ncbi:MAG: SCO family protein [Mesorhizobium sp.]|nr:MAG: SCO family protein [Mesorhizobium sp.]